MFAVTIIDIVNSNIEKEGFLEEIIFYGNGNTKSKKSLEANIHGNEHILDVSLLMLPLLHVLFNLKVKYIMSETILFMNYENAQTNTDVFS